VNYVIVTMEISTICSEHKMYFFHLYLIQFTVSTHSSVTAANRTHVYYISNSELPVELDPAILTLSSGTFCIRGGTKGRKKEKENRKERRKKTFHQYVASSSSTDGPLRARDWGCSLSSRGRAIFESA
jgi:hypothetical protein